MAVVAKKKTNIYLSVEELEEIDRRRHRHHMTRSRYLIASALGEGLPLVGAEGLTGRVEMLEEQMAAANKGLAMLGLLDGGTDDDSGD